MSIEAAPERLQDNNNNGILSSYEVSDNDRTSMEALHQAAQERKAALGMPNHLDYWEAEEGFALHNLARRTFSGVRFDVMAPPIIDEQGQELPAGYVYRGPDLEWELQGGSIERIVIITPRELEVAFSGVRMAAGIESGKRSRKRRMHTVLADLGAQVDSDELRGFLMQFEGLDNDISNRQP